MPLSDAFAQTVANIEPDDLDTELSTPAIHSKQANAIRRIMTANAQSLIDLGYNVELMRDDQVIAITIPLDRLFLPNETSLMPEAHNLLQQITQYTRHYGKYKILLAMHSDDTGSPAYKNALCEKRIISLYEYLDTHGSTPSMVYGYPLTDTQPLVDNNSKKNRSLNRRLEIFIVPGVELLNGLKSHK